MQPGPPCLLGLDGPTTSLPPDWCALLCLAAGNPLKGLEQFGLEQFASSSLPPLDTDLPLELPTDWRSSPASASRDSTAPGTYVSYDRCAAVG